MIPLVALTGFIMQRRGEDARQRLRALVVKTPGIHMARAARVLGMAPSTLDFHVRRLVRDHALEVHGEGHTRHLFPPTRRRMRNELAMLATPEARQIAHALSLARRAGIQEVSSAIGLSRKVTRKHLLAMAELELVSREPGHHGKFVAEPRLREALTLSGHAPGAPSRQERPNLPD